MERLVAGFSSMDICQLPVVSGQLPYYVLRTTDKVRSGQSGDFWPGFYKNQDFHSGAICCV
jgi:hypothetical protein